MITARTLVIFVISFYGLRNSRIFLNVDLAGPNVPADYFTEELQASSIRERDLLQAQPRYKNSGLAAEKLQPLKAELEELFTREKIFLRSTLKVSHLAKALGVPEYQVSQIISQGFNESFYDLVNRYRIEEAKERLRSHPAPTILSVAYDVGFNSKSAFNTAFKSRTGMTPSAFMAASMPARSG